MLKALQGRKGLCCRSCKGAKGYAVGPAREERVMLKALQGRKGLCCRSCKGAKGYML